MRIKGSSSKIDLKITTSFSDIDFYCFDLRFLKSG